MKETYKLILEEIKKGNIEKSAGLNIMRKITEENKTDNDIAIIGIGGIFPKSENIKSLWQNLRSKTNFVNDLSYIRKKDLNLYLAISPLKYSGILKGAMLDRIDEFDYELFKIPPKEAALMNPAQRLLFHSAYSAVIDAGYNKENLKGRKAGVYIGYCDYVKENYGKMIYENSPKLMESSKVGNIPAMMAGRLSRFLNITGPSMVIDTACSSSLTSVTIACKDLLDNNIESAIVSGIRINTLPINLEEMKLGIDSKDAYCRTFDEYSSGVGFGEGVGTIILKRLSDAEKDKDYIYAVIKGYSINNESEGISVTAPTVEAQSSVILDAWKKAKINPEDIGYIELHGTGTRLGDSIEFYALDKAFKSITNKKGICAVGSVKSMFGHLSEASGILALIKTSLMLDKHVLLPSINFNYPNKNMNLIDSAIFMNTVERKWESSKKRIAGINSFGISGLNCHLILEEYPKEKSNDNKPLTYKFNAKRCWYTDYIQDKKELEYYDYEWVILKGIKQHKNEDKYSFLILNKDNKISAEKLRLEYNLDLVNLTDEINTENIIVSLVFEKYEESLLYKVVKYFNNLKGKNLKRLVIICRRVFSVQGEKNYNYSFSMFIGYLKVLAKELGIKEFCVFDLDETTDYKMLFQNLDIKNKEYIAFRNKKIYTKLLSKKFLKEEMNTGIKEKGVYLITGGLGGIGFECAKYLSKTKGVVLILLGRSAFSSEDLKEKLNSLECEAYYYSVDIGDFKKLSVVINEVLQKVKNINGIINCAGNAKDKVMKNRHDNELINHDILRPKVEGTENLIRLTSKIKLDFFISFSSVASVFPMLGQSDYIAANLYLENLMDFHRADGKNAKTILWTSWKETGLTFKSGVIIDTIFKTITNKEGIEYFDAFLKSGKSTGILGKINGKKGLHLLNNSSVNFHDSLIVERKNHSRKKGREVIIKGRADNSYTKLQKDLANIINEYLGYEDIDINDTFFELGIDSIILLKIQKDLEDKLKVKVSAGELFEYSTIEKLAQFIESNKSKNLDKIIYKNLNKKAKDVAIIGIGCRLPYCESKDDYIEYLINGFDFNNELKDIRKKDLDDYIKFKGLKGKLKYLKGSFLNRIDTFDNEYFNIPPNEAKLMAPEQRMALENVIEAVEDAGLEEDIKGTDTELYIAYSSNPRDSYGNMIIETNLEDSIYSEIGNTTSAIGGRIAYYLNLKGKVVNVDTACSSGLTALNMAVESIREGKCSSALVCGIKINNLPISLEDQNKIGILSPDGKTRTFDEESHGFGAGEGIITFLIKDYDEAVKNRDNIYAVIKGIGINNNGRGINLSSPSMAQQVNLLENTLSDAGIKAEDITYVEAHGTATKLGDDIELKALSKVFRNCKKNSCAIGSSKANIGHMSEASGLLGVLKVVLSMKKEMLPPEILFQKPNTNIDFINSPFYVNLTKRSWHKQTALISSFGISGTNAQTIIQGYSEEVNRQNEKDENIFVISAKTKEQLYEYIVIFNNYIDHKDLNVNSLSFTLADGRSHYAHRVAFKYKDYKDLKEKLQCIVNSKTIEKNSEIYKYGYEKYYNQEEVKAEDISQGMTEFIKGKKVDWSNLYKDEKRIPLPVYPFSKKRHWIDIPLEEDDYTKYFYEFKWIKNNEEAKELKANNAELLIFITHSFSYYDLCKVLIGDLKKKFRRITIIDISLKPEKVEIIDDKIEFVIVNNDEDSLEKFIYERRNKLEYILFYTEDTKEEISNLKDLKCSQRSGVINLFYVIKAIAKNTFSNKINISVVTNNVLNVFEEEDDINFVDSSIIGFALCIKHEYPNIFCNIIDVDSLEGLKSYFNYLFFNGRYNLLAIRNKDIYIRNLCKTSQDEWGISKNYYKKNGVYIITGGTGEIALVLAEYLVKKGIKKIALLASESFPKEENWQDVKDEYILNKIRIINKLRKEAHIEIFNLNIANEVKLEETLKYIRSSLGKIKGIFHLAGRSSNKVIVNKSIDDFNRVIEAKVYGIWLLNNKTKKDKLDFIVNFSSGVTLDGEGSQSDYTAANYFLNSYSIASTNIDRKIISIQWTTWQEAGMGRRAGINKDGFFKVLSNKQGLGCLNEAIGFKGANILAGELNKDYINQINNIVNYLPYKIDNEIIEEFNINKNINAYDDEIRKEKFVGEIPEKSKVKLLKGKEIKQVKLQGRECYEEIEEKIALCFASVLGYETIDVNESFFELGGDSILLTRLQIKLNNLYPNMFTITKLFEYNSITQIAAYINEQNSFKAKKERIINKENNKENDIAIVGLGINLESADSLDELYEVLNTYQNTVKEPSRERKNLFNELMNKSKLYSDNYKVYKPSAYLEDIDKFDYEFFGIDKEIAEALDPAQKIMIENIYKGVEDAGYKLKDLKKEKTSLYIAYSSYNEYSHSLKKLKGIKGENIYLNKPSMIAQNISAIFGINGSAISLDTACSSSLIGVHLACNDLRKKISTTSIVTGGRMVFNIRDMEAFKIGVESEDGLTRCFDKDSSGTVISEGFVTVVLKTLAKAEKDKNYIYGVIKGSAVNENGASVGITVPNQKSQEEVIQKAWERSRVEIENIKYVEAHGTGTKIGDNIEVEALRNVFLKYIDKKGICAVGSIKSNYGHLCEGSGILGLVKILAIMKYDKILPNINLIKPNTNCNFINSPLYIPVKTVKIKDENYCCGLSSFGLSGTNCHMVIEKYNNVKNNPENKVKVLKASAQSITSLKLIIKDYIDYLLSNDNVNSFSYTANVFREDYKYRILIFYEDKGDLIDKLRKVDFKEIKAVNKVENLEKAHILGEFKNADYKDIETRKKFEKIYMSGVVLNWRELYKESLQAVPIPGYKFTNKRCWPVRFC